jgi:hypothetical protein
MAGLHGNWGRGGEGIMPSAFGMILAAVDVEAGAGVRVRFRRHGVARARLRMK